MAVDIYARRFPRLYLAFEPIFPGLVGRLKYGSDLFFYWRCFCLHVVVERHFSVSCGPSGDHIHRSRIELLEQVHCLRPLKMNFIHPDYL